MKKVTLLLVLILLLSVCLTSTGICYAWTYGVSVTDTYYEVIDKGGLQTYALVDTEYVESIIIPYSYFFKVTNEASEGYCKISYNGYTNLYIPTSYETQIVQSTTYTSEDDFSQSPYYSLSLSAPDEAIYLYSAKFEQDSTALTLSNVDELVFPATVYETVARK